MVQFNVAEFRERWPLQRRVHNGISRYGVLKTVPQQIVFLILFIQQTTLFPSSLCQHCSWPEDTAMSRACKNSPLVGFEEGGIHGSVPIEL